MYVNASPAAIEGFHRIPHFSLDFHEILQDSEVGYNEIINFLSEGKGTWVRKYVTKETLRFQQPTMTPKEKLWMYFISAKFFPTYHVTEVTCDRAFS